MNFAVSLPNYKKYADVHLLIKMAKEAETAGWDGFVIWDHEAAGGKSPVTDPWVTMGAIAAQTHKMKLGIIITQLAKHSPWKIAKEAATLDQLTDGRFILGIGLGFALEREFKVLGDEHKEKARKAVLDEILEILGDLWTEDDYKISDEHFKEDQPQPDRKKKRPVYIPIWMAGLWPDRLQFRRVAQWNGVLPIAKGYEYNNMMLPEAINDVIEFVGSHRTVDEPFDIIHAGITSGVDHEKDKEIIETYRQAGVTWWMEAITPGRAPVEKIIERIKAGPPRLEKVQG